ncbi:hypothetical protein KCU64_g1028, partial [Aureobasidium melanogenum]
MAQPAPRNIDLSTLWSDGTGQTPTGPDFTQLPRGSVRYTAWLENATTGFNDNAQSVTQHGRIELSGGFPQGYTLWVKGSTEWLYGNPRGNFRSGRNFSDHIPEMLAANDARERGIRARVKDINDDKAREEIRQNNREVSLYNAVFGDEFKKYDEEKDLYVSPHTFFTDRQANAAVLADHQANPRIDIPCSHLSRPLSKSTIVLICWDENLNMPRLIISPWSLYHNPLPARGLYLIHFGEHPAFAQSIIIIASLAQHHYITVITFRNKKLRVDSQGPEK